MRLFRANSSYKWDEIATNRLYDHPQKVVIKHFYRDWLEQHRAKQMKIFKILLSWRPVFYEGREPVGPE